METRRYQKALRFIYNRQHFGIKLGLDNITRLSALMGDPQNAYHTVHIAGTNGKGSTSSFIASILQAAGYRVGLLTSPHMADYRERIRVDGKKISGEEIADFVETYRSLIVRSEATFFETSTALAFWFFAHKKVDWGILETGLGGRLDATNIVRPRVSVITNISFEHTELLGKTIYKIAGEKGGIIKPGVPVVTGIVNNGNDAARRLREISAERNAPIHFHTPEHIEYLWKNGDMLHIKKGPFAGLKVSASLAGRHQVENAYLAVRAVGILRDQGFAVSKQAVRAGLAANSWPGRFMTIAETPKTIIDVAHNREGFAALVETLRRHYPNEKFHFLIGMVEKKKGPDCLRMIAPLAKSISVTSLHTYRSDDPYNLISKLKPADSHIRIYPDAVTAYKDLLKNCSLSDILIIAGSHFLMGDLGALIKRDGF